MAFTNEQLKGLNVASQRKILGQATADDIKNLDYATSKGYQFQPTAPAGKVAIPGAQYDTREKQQSAFSNIQPVGNTLYGIPINTTIPTDKLGEGSNIPPAQPVFGDVDAMMNGIKTGNEGLKATLEQVNTQLRSQEKQDAITARMDSEAEANKTAQRDLQEQTWERFGLGQNVEQLQALMPQIAKAEAEFDKFEMAQEGRIASASSIYGRQALIRRQKAVELAGLSAVAKAYQGNVNMAREIANEAITAQYSDQINYMDNLKVQLDSIKDDLSREDQARATSLELMINERERNIEEEKEKKTAITNLALEIARLGVDSGTVNKILKAETETQAIELAVKSGAFQLSTTNDWTKIGEDENGNDIFYDKTTGQFKTADQLSSAQLGTQVGTIMGLPSYDTRSANPGMVRSDRNNNPGNIKVSDYTKDFEGVIGVESNKAEDGGNFLIFDNPEDGLNAIGRLLLEGKSYQGVNAETAIKRYNGNGAYGARDVGLDPNGDFQSQIQNPAKRLEVARKMAMAEGWSGGIMAQTSEEVSGLVELVKSGRMTDKEALTSVSDENKTLLSNELAKITPKVSVIDQEALNKANKIVGLVDEISTLKLGGATGFLGGRLTVTPNQILADSKISQLTGMLTLDNMGIMKGVLSDADIKIIKEASTSLRRTLSESNFRKELENIKNTSDRVIAGNIILSADPSRADELRRILNEEPTITGQELRELYGINN